jgi:hypothetical protein
MIQLLNYDQSINAHEVEMCDQNVGISLVAKLNFAFLGHSPIK